MSTTETSAVAGAEQVQDVLQRLGELPPGTHGAHAVDLLIADGALPSGLTGFDPKRSRRLFQQRVGQWVRKAVQKGTFPAEHILFENKKGTTTARNLDIETAILAHLKTVGPQSVRGVYYAMLGQKRVGHEKKDYQYISALLTIMRRGGRLDRDLIVDETTAYEGFLWGMSLPEHLDRLDDLEVDPWDDQDTRVEVWVEKATLSQVLKDTFREHRVRALPVHGNFHCGAAHQVAKGIIERGQPVHALYLGDYDPSGLNICGLDGNGVIKDAMDEALTALRRPGRFTISRIGLTAEDVEDPTIADLWVAVKDDETAGSRGKSKGDPNAEKYKATYGAKCWEVDALIATDPGALRERVSDAIEAERDEDIWNESIAKEESDQAWLTKRVDRIKADARRRS
jgi:hypothetical protein